MPDIRLASPQGKWILFTTILGSSMALLDSTVVNVALPRMGEDLDADLAALQWTVNAYMLSLVGLILLGGANELGLHFLYDAVHHLEEAAHDAAGALGGVVGWLVNTLASAVLGLLVGALIVLVLTFTLHRRPKAGAEAAS